MSDEERLRVEAARRGYDIEWLPIEPLSPERQKLFDALDEALRANFVVSPFQAIKLAEGSPLVIEGLEAVMKRVVFDEKKLFLEKP